MKTAQTILLAAALLCAALFLGPGRSGVAQQSPPQPPLPSPPDPPPPDAPPVGTPDATTTPAPADDVPQSTESAPESLEPEVLTHGPVHEAFAEPVVTQPGTELIVDKPPPELINEVPPELMPEGDDVEWIPGYWGWDDEKQDYLWVSGLWRRVPPGQRWVPGHWSEVEGGYTWVAGFWTGADVADLQYLPDPPATLEQGPNIAAPGDNYFWVSGCWLYQSNNYNWQPGYWAPGYDDWCWIPRRYVWTPRGSLFCGGYWDYRLPRRGLLFAPVRFWHRGFWGPGYRYRPFYTINPGGLLVNLFVRPGYRHYYFGDYYGPRFRDRGFRPWYRGFDNRRRLSDPLYSFYDSYYRRRGVDFGKRMEGWHDFYDRHPDRRPERTINVSTRDLARGRGPDGRGFTGRDFDRDSRSPIRLASSLTRLAESREPGDVQLRRLDDARRNLFEESRQQVRSIERTRSALERRGRDASDRDRLADAPNLRDRRPDDDRRDGSIDRRDDEVRGRGGPGGDSARSIGPRDIARERLELPRSVQSRIASREPDGSPGGRSTFDRGVRGRDSRQPGALERDQRGPGERVERSGRDSDSARESRERSQQPPSNNREERGPSVGDRIDRSGRGSDGPPSLRDRVQQTPRSDRSSQPSPRFDRGDQSPRTGPAPRSETRGPDLRQRNEPQRPSPSIRDTPSPRGSDRSRTLQQPSPRPQSPQRRVEPRSSGEIRGRIESRGGGSINRGPQSGSRPQMRSSRPPQTRSQPQIRSSRPQIRSGGSPQIRSRPQGSSRGPSRGSSGRGSSNRGGRGR